MIFSETSKHIIYQTFPRLFGNFTEHPVINGSKEENGCGKFSSYSVQLLNSIKELGITHIWYTGILAHATSTDYTAYDIPKDHQTIVKGKAGSPFAIKDYYDVNPDLADCVPDRMNEFTALVKRTHDAGMKVIIDFIPNHVSRSYHSLMKPAYLTDLGQHDQTNLAFSPSNNFYYLPGQPLELHFGAEEEDFEYNEFPAKVTGNDCFTSHPSVNDWYETIKLNYGVDYFNGGIQHFTPVPDTWHKMLHILLFWAEKEVDGFRCDMAEMVPVQFWNWAIPRVKSLKNILFIAETYNPLLYREYLQTGHFDYLYDKVGTYDLLRSIICKRTTTIPLKNYLQSVEPVIDYLLFFLENHDEQRIASDFFAATPQKAIPALIFITTYRSNPVMIFNGQELGEKGMDNEGFSGLDGKTSIFDYWRMDSIRRWAKAEVLNCGGNPVQSPNFPLFDYSMKETKETKEMQLRAVYQKILRLAVEEKAFSMGSFYSLDKWNDDNPFFPSDRMMTYLRKYENELILICINFDNQAYNVHIKIPEDAFNILHLPDNSVSVMKDLMTGEESICSLTHTCSFESTILELSAKILKFSYICTNLQTHYKI
jgi:glycosidase